MPYRALLVDDERLARKQLRTMLADFPEVKVVAEAAAVSEALAATQTHRPDVVFVDIQMPGAFGFDFLESAEGPFSTIFVTAHDRFALRAFEVNGLDYLLKPIESERLRQAIHRLSLKNEAAAPTVPPLESSDYLFVTSSSAARFIQIKRIQYVLAAGPLLGDFHGRREQVDDAALREGMANSAAAGSIRTHPSFNHRQFGLHRPDRATSELLVLVLCYKIKGYIVDEPQKCPKLERTPRMTVLPFRSR